MDVAYILCFLQVVLVTIGSCFDLGEDLRLLSEMLPGHYTNDAKAVQRVPQRLQRPVSSPDMPAEALFTIPLRATYRPVEVTFLRDCFNVYVEQTLHGKTRPHRRWLYSYSKDDSTRSIKLKVYEFVESSLIEKISKNPRTSTFLTEKDVSTRSNCDMYWRRLGETFVGTTSRLCVAVMDGKQVRISVTTTLTQTSLQIDEGWYDTKDGSRVLELDGPIFMTKVDEISENPFLKNDQRKNSKGKGDNELLKDSRGRNRLLPNKIPEQQSPRTRHGIYKSNTVPGSDKSANGYNSKKHAIYSNAIEKAGFNKESSTNNKYGGVGSPRKQVKPDEEKTMWTLQTYEGIINALESGHKVYFSAKTKKCTHVGAKKREKTSIGDYVNTFEIQKDFMDKQPNKYLQFSLRRVQHTRKGFQDVVKQVTTHRNGTVHILTVYLNEDSRIVRNFFTECDLYDQDTRKGDVRFYLDPYRDVSEITRSKSLNSALQNGNMVRMTTEIDKCSGGQSDHVVIGGEFRGYDMGRNGKTVDFNLKTTKLVPKSNGDISVEEHILIFQFPQRGEITLIRHRKHVTSLAQNLSIVNGYQRYKCEMDPNSSTKAISLYNT